MTVSSRTAAVQTPPERNLHFGQKTSWKWLSLCKFSQVWIQLCKQVGINDPAEGHRLKTEWEWLKTLSFAHYSASSLLQFIPDSLVANTRNTCFVRTCAHMVENDVDLWCTLQSALHFLGPLALGSAPSHTLMNTSQITSTRKFSLINANHRRGSLPLDEKSVKLFRSLFVPCCCAVWAPEIKRKKRKKKRDAHEAPRKTDRHRIPFRELHLPGLCWHPLCSILMTLRWAGPPESFSHLLERRARSSSHRALRTSQVCVHNDRLCQHQAFFLTIWIVLQSETPRREMKRVSAAKQVRVNNSKIIAKILLLL